MDRTPEEILFSLGDPVQAVRANGILGKVTRILPEYTIDGESTEPMIFVAVAGRKSTEIVFYPGELRICKCATRIPKEYCYVGSR